MTTRPFIHDDFLLSNDRAAALYHGYAAPMPIVDYHCHLPPEQIARDHRYRSITEVWLGGDHYKWRAMRTNGMAERLCSGDAPDREKFQAWADTMPRLLGNPLYAWTHLELARYFDVTDLLSPATADRIWETCNARLTEPGMSARGLMTRSNVLLVCTTDDPVDTLEHHRALADDPGFAVRVLPTWRPDKGMAIDDPAAFNAWVDRLGAVTDRAIGGFDDYLAALRRRHDAFHAAGCRLSDHGLDTAYAAAVSPRHVRGLFDRLRSGQPLGEADAVAFKAAMLIEFGIMDAEKDWTQQFHFGAQRNNNTAMFRALGPDTGFDAIGDAPLAAPLARLLDTLNSRGRLTRTILYNLNPRDNALLVTLCGCFQDGTIPGKMQFGAGWWFLDNEDGMRAQMAILAQMGLLSRFVGMLTDSRSFLSYTRHEYFRRILCDQLGRDMTRGAIPDDMEQVGSMVRDICYRNAARYFGFDLPAGAGV